MTSDEITVQRHETTGRWHWTRRDPDGKVVSQSTLSGYPTMTICEDELFRLNARPFTLAVECGPREDNTGHLCAPHTIGGPDHCGTCGRQFSVEEMQLTEKQITGLRALDDNIAEQVRVSAALCAVIRASLASVVQEYNSVPVEEQSCTELDDAIMFAARDLVRAVDAAKLQPEDWSV